MNPVGTTGENIFELEMSPAIFSSRDEGKTLNIESLKLFARVTNTGPYEAKIEPYSQSFMPIELTLFKLEGYGGLYYQEVSGLGVKIGPATPSEKWMLKMAGPNGSTLQQWESEDLTLVLGYLGGVAA